MDEIHFVPLANHGKPPSVGIYRTIIRNPAFLGGAKWISSIHSITIFSESAVFSGRLSNPPPPIFHVLTSFPGFRVRPRVIFRRVFLAPRLHPAWDGTWHCPSGTSDLWEPHKPGSPPIWWPTSSPRGCLLLGVFWLKGKPAGKPPTQHRVDWSPNLDPPKRRG